MSPWNGSTVTDCAALSKSFGFGWSSDVRYAMIFREVARFSGKHREFVMPMAVTLVLFVFWIFMAYRAFERGDMMEAGVFFLVGIVLTVYRYSAAQKIAKAKSQSNAP
jgi:hypothetical protein